MHMHFYVTIDPHGKTERDADMAVVHWHVEVMFFPGQLHNMWEENNKET